MQPIEMPAWKLTADSIWNSFRSSGKRHLLLTGGRGSGKSTLLRRLTPESLPGIVTYAQPGKGVFLRETGTDREMEIGTFDPQLPGTANRMRPNAEGFLLLGIPALQRCVESESPWALVDEIGYLETACPEYCAQLRRLFDRKRVIAAVRRQELPFLTELLNREDAFVLDLDAPFGNIGCVIMASGLGKRFGGNKLLADFQGKPLIAGALAATQSIERRVVVTRHPEVAAYCRELAVPVILHDLPFRSDTVRLGVEAMEGTQGCLFCQGDQPLLRQQTVAAMAMLGAQKEDLILRAGTADRCGAPILFPGQYYAELKTLPQGKGGNYVVKKHPEQVRFVPVQDVRELLDVDTPEDIRMLAEQ